MTAARRRFCVWAQNLQGERPRGVQRVAREVANRLHDTDDIEYLAATRLSFHSGRVSVEVYPLATYLSVVPFTTADRESELRRAGLEAMFLSVDAIDAVLSFECFEDVWGWPLAIYGLRAVGVVHDFVPFRIEEHSGSDSKSPFYRAVANMVMKADLLISVSRATETDLLNLWPAAATKSTVIYNGQGNDVLERAASINWGGFGQGGPVATPTITIVGTVEPRKNHQAVFRALPEIAEQLGCKPIVTVVGDNSADLFGGEFRYLLDVALRYATVRFPGYVTDEDLARHYGESDVLVFASLWEGFGIPILEAMAFGVPIVASDTSSHPEVGSRFVCYCDPYDTSSIADAVVQTLRTSPEERRWKVTRGREWALRFNWEDVGRAYHSAAEYVLARDSKRTLRSVRFETVPEHVAGRALKAPFAILLPFGRLGQNLSEPDATTRTLLGIARKRTTEGSPFRFILTLEPQALTQDELALAVANCARLMARHPGAGFDFALLGGFLNLSMFEAEQLQFLLMARDETFGSAPIGLSELSKVAGEAQPADCDEIVAPDEGALRRLSSLDVHWRRDHVPGAPDGNLQLSDIRRVLEVEQRASVARNRYLRGLAHAGGLVGLMAALEGSRPDLSPADNLTPGEWLAREHAYLEEGIDLLVVAPNLRAIAESREAVAEVNSRGLARAVFVLHDQVGLDTPSDILSLRDSRSVGALALASRRTIILPSEPRSTPDYAIEASVLGRHLALIGEDDPLASELWSLAFHPDVRSALVDQDRREVDSVLPLYPAGWSQVGTSFRVFAASGQLSPHLVSRLSKLLGRSEIMGWGAVLGSAAYSSGKWEQFVARVEEARNRSVRPAPKKFELLSSSDGLEFIGFYALEVPLGDFAFRWTGPLRTATIRAPFTLRELGTLKVVFNSLGKNAPGEVKISVNGVEVYTTPGTRPEGRPFLRASINPLELAAGPLEIELWVQKMFTPGGADQRILGVAVASVSFEAASCAQAS